MSKNPWKVAALAVSIAALMAAGCTKKQTVKSDAGMGAAAPSGAPMMEAPPAPPAPEAAPAQPPMTTAQAEAARGMAVTEEMPSHFEDVHFDFDKSDLHDGGKVICQGIADYMKKHPGAKLLIEGHCDERGTAEYNMALGDRRATSVKNYLVSLGVPASSLSTISYGKERPLDPGHTEAAWAKNRRAHFVLK